MNGFREGITAYTLTGEEGRMNNRQRIRHYFYGIGSRPQWNCLMLRFPALLALTLLLLLFGSGLIPPPGVPLPQMHQPVGHGRPALHAFLGPDKVGKMITADGHAATTSTCRGGESSYIVRTGDTLSAIAARYGTSWPILAARNHLLNPSLIFPGQTICITSVGSQPAVNLGQVGVTSLIAQIFGPYAQQALRVATCESSLNPAAYNPIAVDGSHASGLFQILSPSTWSSTSQAALSPYNALANTLAAHEIFVRDGNSWREWVCQP
jgi:LysM repeat protein